MVSELPFAEACERNKQPILEVLKEILPLSGQVLEIGSGTGQHLVFLAASLFRLSWQPSDRREHLAGLCARIDREGSPNILPPIELDVLQSWPMDKFEAVYSSNTAHIMSWEAVCAMFVGVGQVLRDGGKFCLYGPFNVDGRYTADSNEAFDRDLQARDPAMGLRDCEALERLAAAQRMQPVGRFLMPANNMMLVFEKDREVADERR